MIGDVNKFISHFLIPLDLCQEILRIDNKDVEINLGYCYKNLNNTLSRHLFIQLMNKFKIKYVFLEMPYPCP